MKGHQISHLSGLANYKTIFLLLERSFCKLMKLVCNTAVTITRDRDKLAVYLNVISSVWHQSRAAAPASSLEEAEVIGCCTLIVISICRRAQHLNKSYHWKRVSFISFTLKITGPKLTWVDVAFLCWCSIDPNWVSFMRVELLNCTCIELLSIPI